MRRSTLAIVIRLVAHALPAMPSLACREAGTWLWKRMRVRFPDALAAVVLPHRIELVQPSVAPERDRMRLARMLGQLARIFEVRGLASDVSVQSICGVRALARATREVVRAPCREGLVACPLAWPGSTHRDSMGTVVAPSVTAERIACALDDARPELRARLHAWASREDDELGA